MRLTITALISLFMLAVANAETETDVQIGLSSDVVEISSNFDGADIVIFGSIENGDPALLQAGKYDIVVLLAGPMEEVVVRKREKRYGLWMNGAAVNFGDVPASYSVATSRPLSQIADASDIKLLQLGLDNLSIVDRDNSDDKAKTTLFRDSLTRLKENQKLYLERIGGIKFLSPTLFKASLAVPANVPIGNHVARAFLFQDGKFINSKFLDMRVKKIGFEEFTYQLAHSNGILYGILAVFIALLTGWMANLVFGKD